VTRDHKGNSSQVTNHHEAFPEVLCEGSFLHFKRRGHWEYVERCTAKGCVAILAVTDNQELILVEQFRPPVECRVIEIPAGLVGDGGGQETLARAAGRELLEETGYEAKRLEYLTDGPSSAGLSTEVITFFRAQGLRKVGDGGGDQSEEITVHLVPLAQLQFWLDSKRREGCLVDYKVYTALYFLG